MDQSEHLHALLEKARANHAARVAAAAQKPALTGVRSIPAFTAGFKSLTGVPLNPAQLEAVETAMRGKSFNLCGAAGTGKTTTTREVIGQLVKMPHVHVLDRSTKYLQSGTPSIAVISFTNKAVNNLKKFLDPGLRKHCLTYHKLLEFKPARAFDPLELQELGVLDAGLDSEGKKTSMFLPSYHRLNKLPHLAVVIMEESSMVDTVLHQKLLDALPHPEQTQFIALGDLNQLPPIFGPSILGYRLTEQPTIELTHVYRQALESPIITLAHQIREGRGFTKGRLTEDGMVDDRGEHGIVTIRPWKKKLDPLMATKVLLQKFLIPLVTSPDYDMDNSVVLCPFNKSFGTIELNKGVADALAKKRGAIVHEVIARYQKSYWAEGDRVLVDRREAVILDIKPNTGYDGQLPEPPSATMDRWGRDPNSVTAAYHEADLTLATVGKSKEDLADELLSQLVVGNGEEGAKNQASHQITVQFCDDGAESVLRTAGEINSMLFSYVLTVHKSQGSEWRNVYLLLHYSHNTMLSRELLYTAVTRARHQLYIICEPDRGTGSNHVQNSINRAATNPEIKGVTLAEKAAYFSAKKAQRFV